jgi:hypothetical protein
MTTHPIPSAADLLTEAATIAQDVALVAGMTAQQKLRGAVAAADQAYTAAVQAAVRGSGDWGAVQKDNHVFMQARNAAMEPS